MKSRMLLCCLALLLPTALVVGGCPGGGSSGCPIGQSKCDGTCIDTTSDRSNCGTCGNSCLDGQYCAAGNCVACQNECMMGDKQCAAGSTTQYQECGDPDGDTCLEWAPAQACGAGQVCDAGDCITACTDECAREDSQVCDTGGANGYRVCGDFDDDACLEYGDLVPCGAGETCVAGTCEESCADECPNDGDRMCAEPPDNGFLVCGNYDGDSCREWGGLTLCPGGETCNAGACSSDCNDDCTAGQRICEGNGYRTCGSFDADPCLDWSSVTNCAGYELCTDGVCETACQDECAAAAKRCNGDNTAFEVCGNYDADPCLEFGNLTPCAGGEICENGNCVEDCQDECPNNGARICDGDGYRTCRANVDADTCLEWSDITSCPQDQSCIAGVCSDVCITECADGERECNGNGWRECVAVPDPQDPDQDCWVWGTVTPCDPFYACDPGTAQCVLTCSDDCPAGGARQCTGDLTGYQECGTAYDADPCLEWGAAVDCPQFYECDPGSAQCVLSCNDECLPAGEMRCTGDGLGTQECGDYDADPCLEWGNDTPCPGAEVCSGGVCALDCVDECDTDGEIVCSAVDPTGKTYQVCGEYDGDACLDLSNPLTCGYGEQCDAGEPTGCAVVCTDDCPTLGLEQCTGFDVEICDDGFDADECLEWGVQESCDAGTQLCYNGGCVANTPPTVVLINEFIYDNQGSDTQDGNWLFIELFGTAGQSLNGYSVVGVNGNSGAANPDYMVIPLDGYSIPADGHFVITRTNAEPTLLAESDLQVDFDPQNGPDNLQVRWAGSIVVDAVGYEAFDAGDNWAGEGVDYTDAAASADYDDPVTYCLSRSVDHRDDDVNRTDFYRRTLNNCSPGWEGPGSVVGQAYVWGGTSTPAFDTTGNVWTVDSYGWINITRPDLADADDTMPPSGVHFQSSVAIDPGVEPNVAYIGSDSGVYGYTMTVTADDPFAVSLTDAAGWPVLAGTSVVSTPAVSLVDGGVFFGTQGSGIYGYNWDGSMRFNVDTAGAYVDSSPAIGYLASGDEVLVVGVGGIGAGEVMAICTTATGSAPCVNAGDVLWSDASPTGGCNSSPAISDGVAYVGCDDGGLYAFDLEDGTWMPGFPIDIANGGAITTEVDGCSPVAMSDGAGNSLIRMTSRAPDGDLYLLSYDGSTVTGTSGGLGLLMSSAAMGADGSSVFHMGPYLAAYAMDGSLQWDALVSSDYPADAWIHSSPTWVPTGTAGLGIIVVVDPFDGNLWAILATADPSQVAGAYPQFHGDWFNSGSGW